MTEARHYGTAAKAGQRFLSPWAAMRQSRPSSPADMTLDAPTSGAADRPDLTAPSLRRRMACWLYEGMLMFGVVFIAGYLFSALTQQRHALEGRHALQGFLFVVFGIYFTWFWHKGQTLAQKTWHIRVVDAVGQPIGQARAFVRYALSWLWLLPPLALSWVLGAQGGETAVLLIGWVLVYALLSRLHAQRQFLHDALAGTRLVHQAPPPPAKKPKKDRQP
jgi:uncharacterized RDD family membrane protein YckC